MRVELSRFIESDLEEIADWIAQDNPGRAGSFVQELRGAFRRIGQNPQIYRIRSEIGHNARIAVLGRYVILFRVDEAVVRIQRVVHGGRDLPRQLE